MHRIKVLIFNTIQFFRYPKLLFLGVRLHPGVRIYGDVLIGRYTNINGPAYISSGSNKCIIGKYCAIGHNLRVRGDNHNMNYLNLHARSQNEFGFGYFHESKGSVVIGNAVWIGDNVIILPGVSIGDGAVIGAGSVVTKNVPPYSVVVGVPAKVIKLRFNEWMIDELNELRWWDWSNDKILQNKKLFSTSLDEINDLAEFRSLIC
ncbi:MAG: hypothetical protein CMP48_02530 [Rickettsiales bacterium]|nr:hypothetical protein [Rickettsiales bacterium]